jgi:hypothetical protein
VEINPRWEDRQRDQPRHNDVCRAGVALALDVRQTLLHGLKVLHGRGDFADRRGDAVEPDRLNEAQGGDPYTHGGAPRAFKELTQLGRASYVATHANCEHREGSKGQEEQSVNQTSGSSGAADGHVSGGQHCDRHAEGRSKQAELGERRSYREPSGRLPQTRR